MHVNLNSNTWSVLRNVTHQKGYITGSTLLLFVAVVVIIEKEVHCFSLSMNGVLLIIKDNLNYN